MYGVLPELHYVHEFGQTLAIKRAVLLNLGVACLSRLCVEAELKQGTLVELKVPDRNFKRYFYVILHKDKYISPGVEKWLDFCGLVIEEIYFFR
jgi:DNA-binding transcriptional LysR family regulator